MLLWDPLDPKTEVAVMQLDALPVFQELFSYGIDTVRHLHILLLVLHMFQFFIIFIIFIMVHNCVFIIELSF